MVKREVHAASRRIGNYHLFEPLSSGGTADVHFARQVGALGFERTVAIKSAHTGLEANSPFRKMLEDEARIVSRIRHSNVIAPVDVVLTDSELFLVLEYVPGETIAELIALLESRIPIAIACTIMAGALRGLHAAHEARDMKGAPLGIIHRDVSPQNILVGEDGVPRVFDFGIALARDRTQTTEEGVLKGKLAYMSPEQISDGFALDCRTDIYSAGVVLWEMLTGRRLFKGSTPALLLEQLQIGATKPPSAFAAEIPVALDDIVMRALSPRRDDRFPTALEFAKELETHFPPARADALAQWLTETAGVALRERAKRVQEIESTEIDLGSSIASPDPSTEAGATRSPRRWVVAGVLLLLGSLALFARRSATEDVAPPRELPENTPSISPSIPSAPVTTDRLPPSPSADTLHTVKTKAVPRITPKIRPGCDPPYDIDPHGQKVYRRACIR
ncbi:MAG: serine/threonine protein kinase [Polyangiaceae bacterium]|nr:serine/threonine protein kinase [Polyangiaceae bacterium]